MAKVSSRGKKPMNGKGLKDSERHELWLTDIENRLRFLEALHTPAFSSFEEKELELPVVSRIRPRENYEHRGN